jgi:hypothetical protein
MSCLFMTRERATGCFTSPCATWREPTCGRRSRSACGCRQKRRFSCSARRPGRSATPPTVLRPDLPHAVDEVFARVLAKRPGDRWGSCREFMAAAQQALGSPAEPRYGPRASRGRGTGAGAVGGAVYQLWASLHHAVRFRGTRMCGTAGRMNMNDIPTGNLEVEPVCPQASRRCQCRLETRYGHGAEWPRDGDQ